MSYGWVPVLFPLSFSVQRSEISVWEINLLKILDANVRDVKSIVQIEFGILGFFAAITGVVLSLLMSYSISYFIFDSLWRFSVGVTSFTIIAITVLRIATALIATRSVLKQKPLELLRAV